MPVDRVDQAWGLEGYDVIEVDEDQDELLICVAWPRDQWRCPECGSRNVICHDRRTRLWQSAPVGLKKTRVAMDVPRTLCHDCGCKRTQPPADVSGERFNAMQRRHRRDRENEQASPAQEPAFAEGTRRHSIAFEQYAAELLRLYDAATKHIFLPSIFLPATDLGRNREGRKMLQSRR
jgi:transposase